ncbi:MAG: ABC transporter ATP-binding protein [Verrucomicrobia bacterium]|nr:ABC transporter ATP-binding protein [Verrucomicrobiota bacterium]
MLATYLRCFLNHAGNRVGLSVVLTVVVGVLEGAGLVVLLPVLELIGTGGPRASSGLATGLADVWQAVGLPLTLPVALVIFIAFMAAQIALRHTLDLLNAGIETAFTSRLREELYAAMVRADWLFFTRQRASDITQVLTDEIQRVGFGTQQLLAGLGLAGVALVQASLALALSPVLTALALGSGLALALALRPLTRRAYNLGKEGQERRADMAAAITEHLAGLKVAKSHGREAHHLAHFRRVLADIVAHILDATRVYATTRAAYELGAVVVLSLFLFAAVRYAGLSTPELLLLVFIFARLLPRLAALQSNWQRVMHMIPSFTAAEQLREQFIAAQEAASPPMMARVAVAGEVCFDTVSFRYPGVEGREVLAGVSLKIPARQMTAICGPSGAGKSTIADLLLGLLRPSAGRVLVDDAALEGERVHAWRASVGYVPQETFLFHESIRANLLWARPEATEAELVAALRAAAAEEFVSRLPQGLETIVGDRGVRLSGGERQRLALARALLRQPTLLVLDEATSALDTVNEQIIQQAIERLHGELTLVIIAHRLSTVQNADQVIVLEHGRVVESGAPGELTRREGGAFRRLMSAGLDLP